MSKLEQAFELEIDDSYGYDTDHELEATETYDQEYSEDYPENEHEYDGTYEENEYEFEANEDFPMTYGERLFEIAQREFETEYEMDEALSQVMEDMEREYFLKDWIKKGAKFMNNNAIAKGLISKGLDVAASFVPGGTMTLEAVKTLGKPLLQGLQNNWRGAVKAGTSALAPEAAGMANRFARRLGINANLPVEHNQEVFERMAQGIQRSYEFAAQHFGDHIGDPVVASRLANKAFEVGINAIIAAKPNTNEHGGNAYKQTQKGVRTVRLQEKPGEAIQKIIIVIDRKP